MSAYRCQIHTEEPVTFKGTGCRECGKPRPRKRRLDERWTDWTRDVAADVPPRDDDRPVLR